MGSKDIRLFVLGSGWGIPFGTAAPFPLKLATWMRMANIAFEMVVENNPGKGPKGKSPWIECGTTRMADSSLIIEWLAAKHGIDMDTHLSSRERALATALQRMLEEHYHQCFEHQLFFGEGGAERMAEFGASLPGLQAHIVPPIMKRAFRKQLHARGMGRHSQEVVVSQGKADLDALDELLQGPFMFGDKPASIDATVFGFLGVSVYVSGNNPLFRHAASLPRLMAYCEHMRAQYFPETAAHLPLRTPHDGDRPQRRSSGANA